MVQVIGHRDDIVHEATCHGCGSILAYRRADVKYAMTETFSSRQYRYIDCPVCKEAHAANPNIANIGRVEVKN